MAELTIIIGTYTDISEEALKFSQLVQLLCHHSVKKLKLK